MWLFLNKKNTVIDKEIPTYTRKERSCKAPATDKKASQTWMKKPAHVFAKRLRDVLPSLAFRSDGRREFAEITSNSKEKMKWYTGNEKHATVQNTFITIKMFFEQTKSSWNLANSSVKVLERPWKVFRPCLWILALFVTYWAWNLKRRNHLMLHIFPNIYPQLLWRVAERISCLSKH